MTPSKLALAFSRLHVAITGSNAAAVLEPLCPYGTAPKPDLTALLHVFATLSSAQAQFGEAERSVLAAFGLQAVTDTAWWATLITACTRATMNDEAASMIEEIHARLRIAMDTFPALAGLVDVTQAVLPDVNGVVILLPGIGGVPPSLARVAGAIEALNQLWTVAEELTGHRGALCLIRTEPGATMALHFDGHAEPLAELRALLASIWDQMARLPKLPPEQHPALVAEMLPVMQRIGQSGRSDAMRVRSAVEGGVRRLLEAGCTLPVAAPAIRGPRPATAPASAPVTAAKSPAAKALDEDDISHLAAVIAEERSQLKQTDPSRRLWHGAATHPA